MCVLAGTATRVCLEKGPRMSDISGESTGTDVPVCAKCGTPFDLYGAIALLYGYWLYRTGGVKERRTTTETGTGPRLRPR